MENKTLIEIFNEAYRESSKNLYHSYLKESLDQKLVNEVIQELGNKYSNFNGSTKESIIEDLVKEFDMELAQNPPIAFLIQLVEAIDQEITKLQRQNSENLSEIKSNTFEINKTLESNKKTLNKLSQESENVRNLVSGFQTQLTGIEDRVTERVQGSLTKELQKIGKLEANVDNINDKIPTHLPGRQEFWGGIITAIGAVGMTLLILNSKIDSVSENSQRVNEIHINSLETQINTLKGSISKFETDMKEDNNRIEKKVDQILTQTP